MILLEWNIYPESYFFYLRMLPAVSGTQHGLSSLLALVLLSAFIFLPVSKRKNKCQSRLVMIVGTIYICTAALKVTPFGREYLVDIRLPLLRAIQVVSTTGMQIVQASVIGDTGPLTVRGHLYEELQSNSLSKLPDKILVVVLESWGESSSDLLSFKNSIRRRSVEVAQYGHTPYRGSTLPGEVRELCGRLLDFRESGFDGQACLPHRFRKLGFNTTSFHGYESFFYYRNTIYAAMGFKNSYFRRQLLHLEQCPGAFTGVCDDVLARQAVEQLFSPGQQFVYMLSLAAHEPVSPLLSDRAYIKLATTGESRLTPQVTNRALIQLFVDLVAADAERNAAHTWLYVVGDHNPPSFSENPNSAVYDKVPYMLIEVNKEPSAPKTQ